MNGDRMNPPVREFLPKVLPHVWREIQSSEDGVVYRNSSQGLVVIVSMSEERDGARWIHFSMSQQNRMPTWLELRAAKNLFVGSEHKAIQVLPPESEYVNIDPRVLHLWWCPDKPDLLPDFTRGGRTL